MVIIEAKEALGQIKDYRHEPKLAYYLDAPPYERILSAALTLYYYVPEEFCENGRAWKQSVPFEKDLFERQRAIKLLKLNRDDLNQMAEDNQRDEFYDSDVYGFATQTLLGVIITDPSYALRNEAAHTLLSDLKLSGYNRLKQAVLNDVGWFIQYRRLDIRQTLGSTFEEFALLCDFEYLRLEN